MERAGRWGRLGGVGIALLSGLLLLQTRCGGNEDGPTQQGDNLGCQSDRDCAQGETCNRGSCTTASGGQDTGGRVCSNDIDCLNGQVCVDGACAPGGDNAGAQSCQSERDCLQGQMCQAGVCTPSDQLMTPQGGSFCQADADCGMGERCMNGRCLSTGSPGEG